MNWNFSLMKNLIIGGPAAIVGALLAGWYWDGNSYECTPPGAILHKQCVSFIGEFTDSNNFMVAGAFFGGVIGVGLPPLISAVRKHFDKATAP